MSGTLLQQILQSSSESADNENGERSYPTPTSSDEDETEPFAVTGTEGKGVFVLAVEAATTTRKRKSSSSSSSGGGSAARSAAKPKTEVALPLKIGFRAPAVTHAGGRVLSGKSIAGAKTAVLKTVTIGEGLVGVAAFLLTEYAALCEDETLPCNWNSRIYIAKPNAAAFAHSASGGSAAADDALVALLRQHANGQKTKEPGFVHIALAAALEYDEPASGSFAQALLETDGNFSEKAPSVKDLKVQAQTQNTLNENDNRLYAAQLIRVSGLIHTPYHAQVIQSMLARPIGGASSAVRLSKIDNIKTMTVDQYDAGITSGLFRVPTHYPDWSEVRSTLARGSRKWSQCADPVRRRAGAAAAAAAPEGGVAAAAAAAALTVPPTALSESMLQVAGALRGLAVPTSTPQEQRPPQRLPVAAAAAAQPLLLVAAAAAAVRRGPPSDSSSSDGECGTPSEYHAPRGRDGKKSEGCIMTFGRHDKFRALRDGIKERRKQYGKKWIFVACFEGTAFDQRGTKPGYMKVKWLRNGLPQTEAQ